MPIRNWPKVLDAALNAVSNGITVADARNPGRPLTFVNQAFERITGYGPEESLGRNCSFLQGKDTNPETVTKIREALDAAAPCHVVLRNYRRDGTSFLNELKLFPISEGGEPPTHFLGVQNDVTGQFIALALQNRIQLPAQMKRHLESFSPQAFDAGVDVDEMQRGLESVGVLVASSRGEVQHRDAMAQAIMNTTGGLRPGATVFDLFEGEGLIDCFRASSRPSSQWIPARLRDSKPERTVLLRAHRASLTEMGTELMLVLMRGVSA